MTSGLCYTYMVIDYNFPCSDNLCFPKVTCSPISGDTANIIETISKTSRPRLPGIPPVFLIDRLIHKRFLALADSYSAIVFPSLRMNTFLSVIIKCPWL